MKRVVFCIIVVILLTLSASAQHEHGGPKPKVQPPPQEHKMDKMDDRDMETPPTFINQTIHHTSSGTSAEPNSVEAPMWMAKKGRWDLMLHGVVFLNTVQQGGPRGYDKVFSTNWFMPMAQRSLGNGTLTLRAMLSLEPATVTGRSYPALLQQGETAFGRPLVDGQHPHEFLMELAALYDVKLGDKTLLSLYGAAVGDPALGPAAFPHRASAAEDPMAPLGHHLQDSTHIADDVITLGLTHRAVRVEASAFHGREPDEFRWDINGGALDSWSTRLTVNPAPNWSWQYSIGRLNSPEATHATEDVLRMTSSLMYNRDFHGGSWASTLLWGRNRFLPNNEVYNSYLAESTVSFREKNHLWGRIENVDRSSELLLGKAAAPPGFHEDFIGRAQAVTAGYSRELPLIPRVSSAIGGQVTWYGVPTGLKPAYGDHPAGVLFFLRFRPAAAEHH